VRRRASFFFFSSSRICLFLAYIHVHFTRVCLRMLVSLHHCVIVPSCICPTDAPDLFHSGVGDVWHWGQAVLPVGAPRAEGRRHRDPRHPPAPREQPQRAARDPGQTTSGTSTVLSYVTGGCTPGQPQRAARDPGQTTSGTQYCTVICYRGVHPGSSHSVQPGIQVRQPAALVLYCHMLQGGAPRVSHSVQPEIQVRQPAALVLYCHMLQGVHPGSATACSPRSRSDNQRH